MRSVSRSVALVLTILLAGVPLATPAQAPAAGPDAAELFESVRRLRDEIDRVRVFIGRPPVTDLPIAVGEVSVREVYFQADTLLRKIDRLAQELTGSTVGVPQPNAETASTVDVQRLLDRADQRIGEIKREFGIRERAAAAEPRAERTAADVFIEVVQANRQLNLMLSRRLGPGDVYARIDQSIEYASGILARDPEIRAVPVGTRFQPGKFPVDVYGRLVDCLSMLHDVGQMLGEPMLRLDAEKGLDRVVEPSDVYDVATVVLAEVAFLHARLGGDGPRIDLARPGRAAGARVRLPAHAFQRAGVLREQLALIHQQVQKRSPVDTPPPAP